MGGGDEQKDKSLQEQKQASAKTIISKDKTENTKNLV